MKPPKYYRRFDYDRALLPNRHLASLEEGVADIETARERTGATIGYPAWGILYYTVLGALHPDRHNVIVETGTNIGCSTIVLAQALIDSGAPGHVHTVEIDPDTRERAIANLQRAGVAERVESLLGDAKKTLRRIAREVESVRVAFLDGSHKFRDVVREFEHILPVLEDDSIVIFDNTYLIAEEHEDQRVHGALGHILSEHGGNLINFPYVSWHTPGMAIWQRARV